MAYRTCTGDPSFYQTDAATVLPEKASRCDGKHLLLEEIGAVLVDRHSLTRARRESVPIQLRTDLKLLPFASSEIIRIPNAIRARLIENGSKNSTTNAMPADTSGVGPLEG